MNSNAQSGGNLNSGLSRNVRRTSSSAASEMNPPSVKILPSPSLHQARAALARSAESMAQGTVVRPSVRSVGWPVVRAVPLRLRPLGVPRRQDFLVGDDIKNEL